MPSQTGSLQRQYLTQRMVLIAVAITVGGVLFLALAEWTWLWDPLRSVSSQIGGLLVAAGVLSVLWDLFGRRELVREVMQQAGLKDEVAKAGLESLAKEHQRGIEWETLIAGATTIDLFVAYGSTWRNVNRVALETFLSDPGRKLNIYLPKADDAASIKVMAVWFGKSADELESKIKEAVREFTELATSPRTKATVTIHAHPGGGTQSMYRFDGVGVMNPYSHRRSRTSRPAFQFGEGGFLFDYLNSEFEAVAEQSQQIYPAL